MCQPKSLARQDSKISEAVHALRESAGINLSEAEAIVSLLLQTNLNYMRDQNKIEIENLPRARDNL